MASREEKFTLKTLNNTKNIYYAIIVVGLLFGGMIIQSLSGLLPYNQDEDEDQQSAIILKCDSNAYVKWNDGNDVIMQNLIDGEITITLIEHEVLETYLGIFTNLSKWYYNRDGFSNGANFPDVSYFGYNGEFIYSGQEIKISLNTPTDTQTKLDLIGSSKTRYDIYGLDIRFSSNYALPRYGEQDQNGFIELNLEMVAYLVIDMIMLIQENMDDNGGQPTPDEDIGEFIDVVIANFNSYSDTANFDTTKNDEIEFELTNFVVDENGRDYNSGDPLNDFHSDFNEYIYFNLNGISHVISGNMTAIS
jgi:hypothetical protein